LNLRYPLPAEQAVYFIFDDAVAFTGVRLEAAAVENADSATAIMDQAGVLQVSGSYRHTLSSSAKHICYKLLGHQEIRAVFPVVTQQQPSAEPLFHRMQSVANGGLGNLRDQGLYVSQKQALKGGALLEFLLYPLGRQLEGISRNGDNSPAARRFSSQKDCDPRDSVISHQAHLRGRSLLHGVKHGNN
jgi:hypothetical protein